MLSSKMRPTYCSGVVDPLYVDQKSFAEVIDIISGYFANIQNHWSVSLVGRAWC